MRSLRNKITNLEVYLQNNPEIDVILLNEVWIYPEEVIYYKLTGFDSIFWCRAARGGGTVIYCKKTLTYSVIQNDPNKFFSIIVEIKLKHRNLKISTFYKTTKDLIPQLCTTLEANYAAHRNILLIADANADLRWIHQC